MNNEENRDNFSGRVIIELDLSDATKAFICDVLGKDGTKYLEAQEERIKNTQKALNELLNGVVRVATFQTPEERAKQVEDPIVAETNSKPRCTVEDLKKLASAKAKLHRDAIRAKLSQFGVNKIGDLSESAYNQFYDFLNQLKD